MPRLTETEGRQVRIYAQTMEAIVILGQQDPSLDHHVCSSRAVVFGKTKRAQAFLNLDETLLFTDFQFEVDHWIRPAAGQSSVQISVGGGRARVGGKTLIDIDYGVFLEVEQRYAVFLRWDPELSTHFLKQDPLAIAGGQVIVPGGKLQPETEFLTRLRTSAATCKEP